MRVEPAVTAVVVGWKNALWLFVLYGMWIPAMIHAAVLSCRYPL